MRRWFHSGVLTLITAAALSSAGCGSDESSTPTIPTPTAITETFSGTLTVNGAVTFPFFTNGAGSANLVVKTLTPDLVVTTAAEGLGVFTAGETVFQGPGTTTSDATWTAIVHNFTPATNILTIRNVTGGFTPDGLIVGVDSGAAWAGKSITTTVVGIAMGTWSGTTCSVVLANDVSGVGGQITGAVQGAGTLCARVYDVGRITDPVAFTIEVTHF